MKKMDLPVEMVGPYRRISCEAIDKIIVNQECVELIKEMRAAGSKIAICTGKDHYRTEQILEYYGIADLFNALVSSDDVSEPKPSAIPIMKAVEELGVERDTCIVIGDGYNDILSARNAGVPVILTLWYGDVGVPRAADFTVKSVKELEEVLKAQYPFIQLTLHTSQQTK